MKKGILITVGVIAVAAGGMWYTQKAYDEAITNSLAKNAEVYNEVGIAVTRTALSSSFTAVQDRFKFTFSDTFFETLGVPEYSGQNFSVYIDNDCSVYPFYMSCNNIVDISELDIPAEIKEAFKDYTYSAGWTLSPLTNSIKSSFSSDAFIIQSDEGNVDVKSMALTSVSDLAIEDMTLDFAWGGLSVVSDEAEVDIGEISMTGDMTYLSGMTYLGETAVELNSITIDSPTSESFAAKDIQIKTVTSEYEEGKFDVNYIVSSPTVKLTGGQMPIDVSNMVADIRLYGLSEKALTMMNSLQTTNDDQVEMMMELLDEVGSNSPGLAINDISLNYNAVPIKLDGDMSFSSFTSQDIESGEIAAKANAELSAFIGKDVETALPQFAPLLEQYMQAGFIVKDEELNYVSEISVKDRTLSANGNTIQQF